MALSSPPQGLGKVQHREFEMASGEMDEAGFVGFLRPICN